MNEPEETPLTTAPKCVWQLVASRREQWRMLSCHDRPDAGIGLPWPSTAEPEQLIVSPVAQVKLAVGEAMVGVGGAPAVIGMLAVSLAPPGSVTRSCAV